MPAAPKMAPGDAVKAMLAAPSLAKTEHFSLHASLRGSVANELPTGVAPDRTESVDNMVSTASAGPLLAALTVLVPKRHAKRAVTRNLIKRQMREAAQRRPMAAPVEALLIRQRSAFSPREYPSAASAALREVVRRELDALFDQAGAAR